MTSISVVVPLLDDAATIEDCVASVLSQDPVPHEVVVVDNGSSDDGPERVARMAAGDSRIRLGREDERSAAAARNRGWQLARGDVIAFIDADCTAAPGWLAGLAAAFESPEVGAVGGRIRGAVPNTAVEKALAITSTQDPHPPYEFRRYRFVRGGLPSGNLALRRSLLASIGGFDAGFRIGEDHDLCARALETGCVLRFEPRAVVRHHNHHVVGGQIRQAFGYGRAHAHLLKRHARRGWLVVVPRRVFEWQRTFGRGWLALDGPAKILPVLALATWLTPWAGLLFAAYVAHYVRSTRKLLAHHTIDAKGAEVLRVAALRALRGIAIDAGRLVGSIQYRVVCL